MREAGRQETPQFARTRPIQRGAAWRRCTLIIAQVLGSGKAALFRHFCSRWPLLPGCQRFSRQQGHRGPAGGRDSLGVADVAGRARCFGPASVVELLGDQELAAAGDHCFDRGGRLAFRQGQESERGVEGLGRRKGVEAPAAVFGLGAGEQLEAAVLALGRATGAWQPAKASRLTEASVTFWTLRFWSQASARSMAARKRAGSAVARLSRARSVASGRP